jgi:ribonuclease Z
VWTSDEWHITASPGRHSVPVIGLRVKSIASGRTVVYSADTARCATIADLARGADILLHEATGQFPGHVTLIEAARIAREVKANRLIVVHLPPTINDEELKAARGIMKDIDIGRDGDRVIC